MKYTEQKRYETNIFSIENLKELSANYFLFEIVGLTASSDEENDDFDINVQYIKKSLSYKLKHPVTIITRDKKPVLVIRAETEIVNQLPQEFKVKHGDVVHFRKIEQPFSLDFVNYTPSTRDIISRFIQFDTQSELNKYEGLWQPGSGDGFFNITAKVQKEHVGIFTGFYSRVLELPGKGFGFAIDITKKYIATRPLRYHWTREQFQKQRIDKSHFVYQYGNKRYEIKPKQLSDFTVSQYKFERESGGKMVTLLEDIQEKFGPSMPPEVANLPDDASVLLYKTNDGRERAAVAALCYRVFDTEDPVVQQLHFHSIIRPFERRRLIRIIHNNFFGKLMYGSIPLRVNKIPLQIDKIKFIAPDILFGNEVTVSVRNTPDAQAVTIAQLGQKRKAMLVDKDAGFYTNRPFETQYYIIPQTIYNMFGNDTQFLGSLKQEVNRMHPTESGWDPIVITYDDRGKKNAVAIGFEILQKMEERIKKGSGGYAVIMLPSGVEKEKRQHDDLAALVVSECIDEYKIMASIMHSDTLEECFAYNSNNGQRAYYVKPPLKGKYKGYIRGVAINQVLLNNERWPFVLHTPLHADLTIGIDVKRHVAGFTFIDKYSTNILTKWDKSENSERLREGKIITMLTKYIAIQARHSTEPIKKIVIHRDGRLFSTEKKGIKKAIEILQTKGSLPADVSVSLVEIPKHSIIQLRLFEVLNEYEVLQEMDDNGSTLNPEIGSWMPINDGEAFLCSTGREYEHDGSSNPLYVKYLSGSLSLAQIMEDIYFLTCLPYTKPDDCSRYPLTIKITDRRINILGGSYDLEQLDILKAVHS